MIIDARSLPSGAAVFADVCIVGAGAAGISVALQLESSRLNVVVIESGGLHSNAATQSLYNGDVANPRLHCPPVRYRQRRFGGSTTIWGGRCVPLDPIDLEQRSWVPQSGWPLQYEEMARYYPEANALCEAGDADYSANSAVDGGMAPLMNGFVPKQFSTEVIERISRPTDFGRRYGRRLKSNDRIKVYLNANCTEIISSTEAKAVERLIIRTLSGRQFHVYAGKYVLATGGIEIPRLLLGSRRNYPRGVGNEHDAVGRYYMCHLAGTVGRLAFHIPRHCIAHGYAQTWDGVYCRRRIALSAEAQRQLQVGNIIMRLHHPRIPDASHGNGILSAIYLAKPLIGYEYAKRLHSSGVAASPRIHHFLNIAKHPVETATFAVDLLYKRHLAGRKFPTIVISSRTNVYTLDIHAEQQPCADSRITIGDNLDPLGMPRVRIDWRYTGADIETVIRTLTLFQEEIASWGGGILEFRPEEVEAAMLCDGAYGGHHIGTARMSTRPDNGVVDANCRVHGITNLYVAGSAVFPTSGQANPTLTVVALAIRLGQHLRDSFLSTPIRISSRRQELCA
ncbi:MAG TPA: GMC family oxidoreductase [Rhizomicrobium sp.]|jgi:choline dehydrogenase-like flavoprotein|nr:GMC family oxidoreductase [Rhizomicrobium sp.]